MAWDFLGGALAGFLAGIGCRWGWKAVDDPRGRAEAVARIRLDDRRRECPAVDAVRVAEIVQRWAKASGRKG